MSEPQGLVVVEVLRDGHWWIYDHIPLESRGGLPPAGDPNVRMRRFVPESLVTARDQRIAALEAAGYTLVSMSDGSEVRICKVCQHGARSNYEHTDDCWFGAALAAAGPAAREAESWRSVLLEAVEGLHRHGHWVRGTVDTGFQGCSGSPCRQALSLLSPVSAPPEPHLPPAESYPVTIEITEVRQGEPFSEPPSPRPGEQEADR